jgi:hypothetical protein
VLSFYLILLIAKIKKIDTLVITDHNEVAGAIKCKNIFKKHNIEVIVGEEIFTTSGEIIGIGLNKKIEPNLTTSETIKQIRKQNGIVYVPHPYDEKRYKTVLSEKEIEKNKDEIDLIEIHNGRNAEKSFDIKQNEIAEKYNLCKIIGSDAHTFFELGRNYVLTDNKINENNVLKKCKNAIFVNKDCIKFAHKWTKIARLIKIATRGDFNELHGIINRKCRKKV